MKRYNICTARTYKDRDGNDKKAWRTVGQLVRCSGAVWLLICIP
jgi:hypothetical protein